VAARPASESLSGLSHERPAAGRLLTSLSFTVEFLPLLRPADANLLDHLSAGGLGWVVSLRLSSGVDRRQALLGLMATAGALASTMPASALGVPVPEKSYAAFFLGQGGYWFSWGIPYLASQAQELGMESDIFEYSAVKEAWKKITQKKKDGYKIRWSDTHWATRQSPGCRDISRSTCCSRFQNLRLAATTPSRGRTLGVPCCGTAPISYPMPACGTALTKSIMSITSI
jgi:hypothetical protein